MRRAEADPRGVVVNTMDDVSFARLDGRVVVKDSVFQDDVLM